VSDLHGPAPRIVTIAQHPRGGARERHGKAKAIQGSGSRSRVDNVAKATREWKALGHMIGANIRAARVARDIPSSELAAALHTAPAVIQRWERGSNTPSIAALLAVSLALDCPLGELVPSDVRNVHVLLQPPADHTEARRAELVTVMEHAKGNVAAAARKLGLTRKAVAERLKRFGLTAMAVGLRVMTDDDIAKAREMLERGVPKTKIALALGFHRTTLTNLTKRTRRAA
jgi:transcriptional regulator with XRE-family HTH domain